MKLRWDPVEDFSNFVNAVIDKKAYASITGYIAHAQDDADAEIIAGGNHSDTEGYFIEPTVIVAADPTYRTMCEEIFGPVVTIYVYEDSDFEDTLKLVDKNFSIRTDGSCFCSGQTGYCSSECGFTPCGGQFLHQ